MRELISKGLLKIRTKIILIFCLLIILFSILFVGVINQYFNFVLSNNINQLNTISDNVANSISNEMLQTANALQYLVESNDLETAINFYTDENNSWPLNKLALTYITYYAQIMDNMIIESSDPKIPVWKLKQTDYIFVENISNNSLFEINIWKKAKQLNKLVISIKVHKDDLYLTAMLDLDILNERVLVPIKIGEKGFISSYSANNIILMSPHKNQVGRQIQEIVKTDYENQELNIDGIEKFLQMQNKGEQGFIIYDSYWFDENRAYPAKKIASFSPVPIFDGYITITSIADYEETTNQLKVGVTRILLLGFINLFIFLFIFFFLYESKRKEKAILRENKYLNELNKTLQILHENEKTIFHHQRLQIIGTMTSGITHELNNLLTPIMGYASLLRQDLSEDSPYIDDVDEILKASQKSKEIMSQISAIGKRNIATVHSFTKINKILINIKKMIKNIIPPSIEVDFIFDKNSNGFSCNQTQIEQVILNLVLNSIGALDKKEKGKIEIVFYTKELNQLTYGCISVKDNGCGIPSNIVNQIFDPFFTTKSPDKGTGLGLSIVQNIISAHHGFLEVDSKINEGANFIISLPIVHERSVLIKKKHKENYNKSSIIKVLLLEENPSVAKMLERGLKHNSIDVICASNLKDALQKIKEIKFELFLCSDTYNNQEVLDIVYGVKNITVKMPIIVLASFLRKELVEAKMSKIINDYILKPITFDDLLESIYLCLN